MAYRVLGKFGGSNRKMLKESQRLHYVVTEVQGPSIKAEFTDCKASIQLPMEKVRPHVKLFFSVLNNLPEINLQSIPSLALFLSS